MQWLHSNTDKSTVMDTMIAWLQWLHSKRHSSIVTHTMIALLHWFLSKPDKSRVMHTMIAWVQWLHSEPDRLWDGYDGWFHQYSSTALDAMIAPRKCTPLHWFMAMAVKMAMMVGFINTKPYSSTASDAMIASHIKSVTRPPQGWVWRSISSKLNQTVVQPRRSGISPGLRAQVQGGFLTWPPPPKKTKKKKKKLEYGLGTKF